MRILYAANNSFTSYFQLKRFLTSIKNKNIEVKIAAYQKSMGDLNIDYTLDALLNFSNPDENISFNGNYIYYSNEIKRFSPDLIISDLEIYTSIIASELQIKIWQVSPVLLYAALDKKTKYSIGIHKIYSYLLDKNFRKKSFTNFIINAADKRFIVSHLCDTNIDVNIDNRFDFIRPDFILADNTTDKNNDLIVSNNKYIINKYQQGILFTKQNYEQYSKLVVKDIYNEQEYKQALNKCVNYICDSGAIHAADAFYNDMPCIYFASQNEIEPILISNINKYYGKQSIRINNRIKFLSEHI